MSYLEAARADATGLVDLRRRLHADPEVGLHLPRTQTRVLDALAGLPLDITAGDELSSVVAVLRGGAGDRVAADAVLLRADMDALPVVEKTGLDFASDNGGMHACGHDLHTAMLVGAAQLLTRRRAELPGDVVFMFQPGEEGYDGAGHMIAAGVLDAAGRPPIAAYALHVASSIFGDGVVTTRPGAFLGAANVLRVVVTGAGGHGSQPHLAKDPIVVAAEIVTALQALVTRRFDIFDPVVVTVCSFHAGTSHNVIPESAEFVATVRCFSDAAPARIAEQSVRLCRGIAAAHGLDADVTWSEQYPVTANDGGEADFLAATATGLLGPERSVPMAAPLAGSEDFSRVLARVPGAMAFLGACPPGLDPASAPFNHSAYADFDEAVLPDGAALLAALAHDRLVLAGG